MTVLSWATFCEGPSDYEYFEVLIPRIVESWILLRGANLIVPNSPAMRLGRRGRDIATVAAEICETKEAFSILFIHADVGGRSQQAGIRNRTLAYWEEANRLCDFLIEAGVAITPKHETEAWALCDPDAILSVLGYRGDLTDLGLPRDGRAAERLRDPKAVLQAAVARARGRRRRGRSQIPLAAIAQRQSLDMLRQAASFADFEARLRSALNISYSE